MAKILWQCQWHLGDYRLVMGYEVASPFGGSEPWVSYDQTQCKEPHLRGWTTTPLNAGQKWHESPEQALERVFNEERERHAQRMADLNKLIETAKENVRANVSEEGKS